MDMNNTDIIDVDDLVFQTGGGGSIDLNSGKLDDATTVTSQYFRYRTARNFYKNYSCHEMASAVDNGDAITRSVSGFAYVSAGSTPLQAGMRVGVHLPHGARLTSFQTWVWDNDSAGYIAVQLCRGTNTGAPAVICNIETTNASASPSIRAITGPSILYNVVDNLNYVYFINVYMEPTSAGPNYIRFYSARITYTMTDIAD